VSRLLALARKELRQLRRDRLTLAMMVMLPVVQLLLFGYAINNDVRHIPVVVLDHDRSATSRDIVRTLSATGTFDVVGAVASYGEVSRALRSDAARVAIVLPPGLGAAMATGEPTEAQLVVDGSDPQIVGSATQTTAGVAAAYGGPGRPGLIRFEPSIWYNPEQRTAVFVVPGLVGVILTMTMVMLTAMAIARERERGTLEALIVSPASRFEVVLGKILPYIVIGYVQTTLILILGWLVFDVPVVGSISLLYVLSSLFIAASLAVGLVFSTIARTQQQAMQMSFFFLLPNILLSGFMFPFEGMPRLAQWLAQALPLTHYLRVVRRIVLKGGGMVDVLDEAVALAVILAVLIVLAAARFRKQLL